MRLIYLSKIQARRLLATFMLILLSITFVNANKSDTVGVFLNVKKELPIYSVQTDEKKIAISFDAAWGAEYTSTIRISLKKGILKPPSF